jgi:hypothetical protein
MGTVKCPIKKAEATNSHGHQFDTASRAGIQPIETEPIGSSEALIGYGAVPQAETKKGKPFLTSPSLLKCVSFSLELHTPVQEHIYPIAAYAVAATSAGGHVRRIADTQVVRRLVGAVA